MFVIRPGILMRRNGEVYQSWLVDWQDDGFFHRRKFDNIHEAVEFMIEIMLRLRHRRSNVGVTAGVSAQ